MDTSTHKSKRPKIDNFDMSTIEETLPSDTQLELRELNASIKKLTSVLERYVAVLIEKQETQPSYIS
jgi:hypothetical protein